MGNRLIENDALTKEGSVSIPVRKYVGIRPSRRAGLIVTMEPLIPGVFYPSGLRLGGFTRYRNVWRYTGLVERVDSVV